MSNIAITGIKSNIAHSFIKLLSNEMVIGTRAEHLKEHADVYTHELDVNRFVFCQGYLIPKRAVNQSDTEKDKSYRSNYSSIVEACDAILDINPDARICIIGSESGYRGSFDDSYADNKKLIHKYIEDKDLLPDQQLVGIAPSIIEDTEMTQSRTDVDNLNKRRYSHPMQRFLTSNEVAQMIYTLLYEQPYINRTIIRMHGGDL